MKNELTTIETMAVSGVIENNSLSDEIAKYYNTISGIVETDQNKRELFIQSVAAKQLADKVIHDGVVESVNLYKELNDFLQQQNSEITAGNYSRWINDFFEYCKNKKIEPLRITPKNAEKYIQYLKDKNYSPNTIRSYIMSVASFYEYLIRHNENLFSFNMFHKLKLPNLIKKRRIDIVTENDIEVLRAEFKRIKRKDFVCLIDICAKYAVRVGAFKEIEWDKNGNWHTVSKGSPLQGKFTKKELTQIENSGILKLSHSTLTNTFLKYTKKLYEDGKISCPFSVHDLRHYCITKRAKINTMYEFVQFSKGIHKNVNTTVSYINI